MQISEQQLGRWTRLFGRPTTFSEDARKAKEVASTVQLFEIGGFPNYHYVKIIVEAIKGWECPLWATDGEWLYLRRPQGVWKTRLPQAHMDRVGVIAQRRSGSSKIYGGVQIGSGFSNEPTWHFHMQKVEPEDLDSYYGPYKDGFEAGPPIASWIADADERVIVDAGDVFAHAPVSCHYAGGEVLAEGPDGRKVRFVVTGLDLGDVAKAGKLMLRFGHGPMSWMDPFDCAVTFSF